MTFNGYIQDTWPLCGKGTVVIVHKAEGQLEVGDRIECVDLNCEVAALPDGNDWNPRTHTCLTGQKLESPQWAFLIDLELTGAQRASLKGQRIVALTEVAP